MWRNLKTNIQESWTDPKKRNQWFWGIVMVAPTMIGLLILNIIPIIQTVKFSLYKTGSFGDAGQFVGLDNYRQALSDPQVGQAILNTFKYTLLVVPISIIISLIVAVLLNQNIKGRGIYRTIYFIPMVAAPAAVAMVWKWLYNTNYGLFNFILKKFNMPPVNWINNPKIAIFSVAIVGIWSTIGYNMVLILAGLQEIPKDYYEAADIDGASKVKQFFSITIPLLGPTLFFVVITNMIQSMQVFDLIYMLLDFTSPAYNSTVSLVFLFYNSAFRYSNRGYGSAIVMILLVIILAITMLQTKIQRKWVNYAED